MDFFEDEPVVPDWDWYDVDDYDEDDTLATVELYGLPVYDVPSWFEADAVVVMVRGYSPEGEAPMLLFRASGNLAPYEIQAILAEGIRETLEG